MKKIKLTQNKYALVDDSDFDALNKYKWHASNCHGIYYPCRQTRILTTDSGQRQRIMRLPWEILGCPKKGMMIDHIDGNGLNNQRNNIRLVTNSQNQMNRSKNKDNTSGFRWVYFDKIRNKWKVQLKLNKKCVHLGYFEDKNNAIKCSRQFAKNHFKEYIRK